MEYQLDEFHRIRKQDVNRGCSLGTDTSSKFGTSSKIRIRKHYKYLLVPVRTRSNHRGGKDSDRPLRSSWISRSQSPTSEATRRSGSDDDAYGIHIVVAQNLPLYDKNKALLILRSLFG